MCAHEQQRTTSVDDVWGDDSDSEAEVNPNRSQLDREWEARKQQYFNAGYREGVEQGKEVTLQQGFNAGFAEGAQAGYNLGAVQGILQLLAMHLESSDSRRPKVQELQQQASALSSRAIMVDTCKALLAQAPEEVISRHLQAALTLAGPEDADNQATSQQPPGTQDSAAPEAPPAAANTPHGCADASTPGAAGDAAGSSSSSAAELALPLQLVAHLKQELLQLGFDAGDAPPLSVASSPAAPSP